MIAPAKNDHASRMDSISLGLKLAFESEVNPFSKSTINKLKLAFEQNSESTLSLDKIKGVLLCKSLCSAREADKFAFFLFAAIDFAYMALMKQWYIDNHDENTTPYSKFKEIVGYFETANSAFVLSQMQLSPTIEQMEERSLEKLKTDIRFKEPFGVSAVQRALKMRMGSADRLIERCVSNGLLVVNPKCAYQVIFNPSNK
ncbi:hypothetical protein QTV43_000469 [Vibrio vulnificus]|nr:hypothetical protein [Vibrio vulnificus]